MGLQRSRRGEQHPRLTGGIKEIALLAVAGNPIGRVRFVERRNAAELGPASARLAYSWRSSYLNTTVGSGATGLPQIQAPYASLDASISYNLNKKISLTLEGVNLNNRMGQTYIGTPTEPLQYSLNDRRFSLILRAYY